MPDTSTARAVDRRQAVDKIETDLLVIGGGAAGLATAVTAARQGLKVTVLERYGFCGGAAVAGLSGTICGLYAATDDPRAKPRQLVHGFVDDFIAAMGKHDGLTGPIRYGKTFTLTHDPLAWRRAADDLLEAAGVRVLFHSTVTEALVEGGERIAGAMAYTKQGRLRVEAGFTVDASGDADLTAMAGFATTIGDNGKVQNPTMIFRLQGVDVARFLAAQGEDSILGPAVSEEIARLLDGSDVDLLHGHHGVEGALGGGAVGVGPGLGQCHGRDLPRDAPLVAAPAAFHLLATVADDGVPVAVGLGLIGGGHLERERVAVLHARPAVQPHAGQAQHGEFDHQHVARLACGIVAR
jgi:hypothetical protein